jgi:hypothetical protein
VSDLSSLEAHFQSGSRDYISPQPIIVEQHKNIDKSDRSVLQVGIGLKLGKN